MNTNENEPSSRTALSDEEIIERFGGIRPMAAKLGIAVTTVQGWKNRGHIPENRRTEIIAAAATHGVDLGGAGVAPSPAAPARPDADKPAAPATPAARPAAGGPDRARAGPEKPTPAKGEAPARAGPALLPAWVALVLALLVTAGLLTRPYWESQIHRSLGTAAGDDARALGRRVDGIAERAQQQYDELKGRLGALEAGGGEAGRAFADQLTSLQSATDEIGRTLRSLEAAQREQAADAESLRAEIAALRQQIDAQEKVVADGLGSLRQTLSALDKRTTELEARPVQTGEKIAALALAVGQVEAALNSGQPYRDELTRLEAIARDDKLILEGEAMAVLARWADYGVPTRTTLYRRFVEIAPQVGHALGRSPSDSWLESAWDSVRGIVSVRRTEGGEDLSPVSRAEAALQDGDLGEAVLAFSGLGSLGATGDAWLTRAQSRLEAERQIRALYGQVIAPLAGKSGAGAQ